MSITAYERQSVGALMFSAGFRIFFWSAGLWAIATMGLWIVMLATDFKLPTAWTPTTWHAHEFLFGYLNAVIGGFLLTAIPNWTGRPVLRGAGLALLFVLWLLGRLAVAVALALPAMLVAVADLAMPVALAVFAAREVIAGNNKRNLIIVALLAILIAGNLVFHLEAMNGEDAARGFGLRTGLAAVVTMIALIGGRITPAFTRNWLTQRQSNALPAEPSRFDALALGGLAVSMGVWVALPDAPVTGGLLLITAGLQFARLARWRGHLAMGEVLILALHIAFSFIPLGAAAMGLVILFDQPQLIGTAQHVWMGGAIGLMTVTVMLRAAIGHTGRPLKASGMIKFLLASVLIAVFARLAAGFSDSFVDLLYQASAVAWIAGFSGFVVHITPMVLGPKKK